MLTPSVKRGGKRYSFVSACDNDRSGRGEYGDDHIRPTGLFNQRNRIHLFKVDQTMSDKQHGFVTEMTMQQLHDLLLGLLVQPFGRFIKQYDWSVM